MEMVTDRKEIVNYNNKYLLKTRTLGGAEHLVLPYVLDQKLNRKVEQPPEIWDGPLRYADLSTMIGKEYYFRSVCNGFTARGQTPDTPSEAHQCHFLHQDDPYLRLGPYKVEVVSRRPFIALYHELFSEAEMDYMVEVSRPNLSRGRHVEQSNVGNHKHEYRSGKKTRIVSKSVQHWIQDVVYHYLISDPMAKDDDDSFTVGDDVMFRLAKKLEVATGLNITGKYASTPFQTTNYGLGGLCETHVDPHGYIEGVELPPSRELLVKSGDMLATVMGWISGEPEGGATAFIAPHKEVTVWPTRGAAAFWYDLDMKGYRDQDSMHGGCPVISGTKWIVNKWIYYYNQWPKYTCSLDPTEKFSGFRKFY